MGSALNVFLLAGLSGCAEEYVGLRQPNEEERALLGQGVTEYDLLQAPFIEITEPIEPEMNSVPVANIVDETGELLRQLLDSDRILVASLIDNGDNSGKYEGWPGQRIILEAHVFEMIEPLMVVELATFHEGFHGGEDNLNFWGAEHAHSSDTEDLVDQSHPDDPSQFPFDPALVPLFLDDGDAAFWLSDVTRFLWHESGNMSEAYSNRFESGDENFGEVYEEWSELDCETWVTQQVGPFGEDLNLLVSETGFQYSEEEIGWILGVSYPFIAGKIETEFREASEAESEAYVFPDPVTLTECD